MHLTVILHKTASHHISLNESSIISTPSLKCNNDTCVWLGAVTGVCIPTMLIKWEEKKNIIIIIASLVCYIFVMVH